MSIHVENDSHGLLAVGHMATELEHMVTEADGPVELPNIATWRSMWELALDTTRSSAAMLGAAEISPVLAAIGDAVPAVLASKVSPQAVEVALEAQVEQEAEDHRKYVAQDAQSDNLIKLTKCQSPEGCTEMVPSTKGRIPPETGLLLCYAHEPKLEGEGDPIDEEI